MKTLLIFLVIIILSFIVGVFVATPNNPLSNLMRYLSGTDDCFETPSGTPVDSKGCPIANTLATMPSARVFRDRLKDGTEGPEMVVISAGRFRMGDIQGDGDDDEQQCVESAGDFVLRGGAWDYYATGARSADRDDFVPTYRSNDCGFRPARIK